MVKEHKLNSAFIMTCVGSLTKATLRLAEKGKPNDPQSSTETSQEVLID